MAVDRSHPLRRKHPDQANAQGQDACVSSGAGDRDARTLGPRHAERADRPWAPPWTSRVTWHENEVSNLRGRRGTSATPGAGHSGSTGERVESPAGREGPDIHPPAARALTEPLRADPHIGGQGTCCGFGGPPGQPPRVDLNGRDPGKASRSVSLSLLGNKALSRTKQP